MGCGVVVCMVPDSHGRAHSLVDTIKQAVGATIRRSFPAGGVRPVDVEWVVGLCDPSHYDDLGYEMHVFA